MQKKIFSLASAQGKKSERKCRKRFSLLRSGEKEKEDRKRKKRRGGVAPLIGAITMENSNLVDRAPTKIVNLPAKKLAHLSLFLETFSIESSVADNFKKNKLLLLWKLHKKFPLSTRDI